MSIIKTIRLALATASTVGIILAAAPSLRAAPSEDTVSAPQKNVSLWVAKAQKVGTAEEQRAVHFSMFLGFKNQDGLKDLIKAQSTPGDKQYAKYLTPDEFRARFAPDAKNVALVQDTLKKLGFTLEYTPKSGLFVQAVGTVGQVKSTFGVSQDLYAYKGKTLRANTQTPRLPAQIAGIVTYVAGLDDTALLRKPDFVRAHTEALSPAQISKIAEAKSAAARAPNAPPPVQEGIDGEFCSKYFGDHKATMSTTVGLIPKTIPWELCSYTPQQIRQAYGADKVSETGKGVRVGIVDLYASPTIVQDTNSYAKNHGLPQLTYLNFQQIVPPGLYNVPATDPCGPQGWYGEETLDIQAVHSMAPSAFIIFGGIKCTDPGNTALYNFIDNHMADIVSNSYSFNGEALPADYIDTENQFFMQAAAEGMSILFSSGDNSDLMAINGIASASFEASSPYVTGVGGTSLALFDKSGAKQEFGWGDYRAYLNNAKVAAGGKTIKTTGPAFPFLYYSGAGGGPSLSFLAPSYQSKVPYSFSGFTHIANGDQIWLQSPHRVTPDISMVADPYTGFITGETYTKANDPVLDEPCKSLTKTTEYCELGIGGTSLASPMMAGVLALVDQARFAHGKAAVGFINPMIYSMSIGQPGTKTAPIIDVQAPTTPTAVLRGYLGDRTKVRVVMLNSLPIDNGNTIVEGKNTSYLTRKGYDETTGLGTPNIPAFIAAAVAK